MARLAMRMKDKKRAALTKKFSAKRDELRIRAVNMKLSEDERQDARTRLNKLPKTALQLVCAIAARSLVAHAATSENSAFAATNSVDSQASDKSPALPKRAGNTLSL